MGISTSAENRRALRGIAATQHGLFTMQQALSSGVSYSGLAAWSRSGEITRAGTRVWALTGSPRTERQTALRDVFEDGHDAVLALGSASAVWDVPGFRVLPAEILRIRRGNRRRDGRTHSSTCFHEGHVTVVDGLPVTTPTRTVFDLAARSHPQRTETLVDTFLRLKLTTPLLLEQMLRELQGRGRAGIVTMRRLIDERLDPSFQLTDSNLESRFDQIAREAGFHGLTRQVVVGDGAGVIGRVDFADTRARVLVEVQSERYHRTRSDQERDRRRLERLRADGWTVLEIDEHDVWHDKAKVIAILSAAYRSAARTPPSSRP